ncbi:MAG: 50S ribosomal protein L23 [Candidatus Omnitrophica bacterium]|nr:50S ribosomal protein L23 [Candidatus Omnitrophota bacterium]
MKSPYQILKSPFITEKTQAENTRGRYTFLVYPDTNKVEIKRAVEKLYKVRVLKVNTINMRGKKKRVRYKQGYTSRWKKAIVKLAAGQKIEIG